MQSTLGEDVVATLVAPSVVPPDMGARIEAPVTRAIVSYWRPAAYDPVLGRWSVVLDSPLVTGEYNLVWRTGDPEPPELEVFVPLSVVSALGAAPVEPGTLAPWAPTVEEVAAVTPQYTVGGFDDDRDDAGSEQATYTESTSPTAEHVASLIIAATDEVQGRVGVTIPERHYGLARTTAKWHVAASISAGKQPADTDDAGGEYRGHITNFRASLDELVRLARMARGNRLR